MSVYYFCRYPIFLPPQAIFPLPSLSLSLSLTNICEQRDSKKRWINKKAVCSCLDFPHSEISSSMGSCNKLLCIFYALDRKETHSIAGNINDSWWFLKRTFHLLNILFLCYRHNLFESRSITLEKINFHNIDTSLGLESHNLGKHH
jgi:hypothetical protein